MIKIEVYSVDVFKLGIEPSVLDGLPADLSELNLAIDAIGTYQLSTRYTVEDGKIENTTTILPESIEQNGIDSSLHVPRGKVTAKVTNTPECDLEIQQREDGLYVFGGQLIIRGALGSSNLPLNRRVRGGLSFRLHSSEDYQPDSFNDDHGATVPHLIFRTIATQNPNAGNSDRLVSEPHIKRNLRR